MISKTILQLIAVAAVLAITGQAGAAGFTLGSIDGQNGWSVGDPAWDEAVTTQEEYAGQQSWQFSNAGTAGSPVGNTTHPQSPQPSGAFTGNTAGEPASGATFDGFLVNFKFRTESEVNADGTEVRIRLASSTGAYISDLAIQNIDINDSGMDLLSLQNGAAHLNDLTPLTTDESLVGPDGGWHDLSIIARFYDGADDTVEYVLNGVSLGGETTTYFEALRAGNSDPYETTNHVVFDGDRTGNSFSFLFSNQPGGIYFDDFSMSFFDVATGIGSLSTFYSTGFEPAAVVPLPATAWMGLTLLAGMGGNNVLRRRRSAVA